MNYHTDEQLKMLDKAKTKEDISEILTNIDYDNKHQARILLLKALKLVENCNETGVKIGSLVLVYSGTATTSDGRLTACPGDSVVDVVKNSEIDINGLALSLNAIKKAWDS